MEDLTHLFGTCACQRNQYTIVIPPSSASLAQVILDNSSAANRSSLERGSLERLRSLRLEGEDEEEEDDGEQESEGGPVEGGGAWVQGDTHGTASAAEGRKGTQQSMSGRGVSYYESSWLGRIKRRKGGHTSADGTRSVEWEIVEMEGDDDEGERAGEEVEDGNGVNKRMRVDL
ncbi:hypothetical protein B0A54_06432 [Friedmanniomyces endolithicus]|uniref:Uncharacterized protein n=1 Tax=Friedmanniomyces endolithicus TaxID=329885 RepID=A0A4U0UZD0_9PEZI|nr:hypothetical protein B0A54_06432 [Friedmanniomyces endolithicus]